MENGKIRDDQITASSQWSDENLPTYGRLNFQEDINKGGAWSSARVDLNQWIQVDFQRFTILTGISTQGRNFRAQFVTKYTISFSDVDDPKCFSGYKVGEMLKVMG